VSEPRGPPRASGEVCVAGLRGDDLQRQAEPPGHRGRRPHLEVVVAAQGDRPRRDAEPPETRRDQPGVEPAGEQDRRLVIRRRVAANRGQVLVLNPLPQFGR